MKRFFFILFALLMVVPVTSQEGDSWTKQLKTLRKIHPWAGKKIAYLGDSITDPHTRKDDTHYWAYLQDWLQTTPLVYGISGHQWNQIPGQGKKLLQEHGQDFDAILIFVGTNDFNASVPIGKWFDEKVEQVEARRGGQNGNVWTVHRSPSMDEQTVCGRINIAMTQLKKDFPLKQIVLLTPIHRAYAKFGKNNIQPDENYQNGCGEYFDAYVETVKEAGNVWAVPVIDLNSESGLFPLFKEHDQLFGNPETDHLHPNANGHRRMALTLMYKLLSLPCNL